MAASSIDCRFRSGAREVEAAIGQRVVRLGGFLTELACREIRICVQFIDDAEIGDERAQLRGRA